MQRQCVDEWPGFCWPGAAGVFVFNNRVKLLNKFSSVGATLSMRSLVKEEPDWRAGIMAGDRSGMVSGPLRLRRGSRFTWRKECQSIMERWVSLSSSFYTAEVRSRHLHWPERFWYIERKCVIGKPDHFFLNISPPMSQAKPNRSSAVCFTSYKHLKCGQIKQWSGAANDGYFLKYKSFVSFDS